MGLCLGFRDFNLSDQANTSSIEFPIKPSDIGDFVPLIKKQTGDFQYAKVHYNMGAQYVANGKYEAAVDIYGNTLQALLNVGSSQSDLRPLQQLSPGVCIYTSCSSVCHREEGTSHFDSEGKHQ